MAKGNSFVINGTSLADVLRKMFKAAPKATEFVQILGTPKRGILEIRGAHENRIVMAHIGDIKLAEKVNFSCTGNRLLAVAAGRGDMTLTVNNNSLHYKAGNYQGSLEISDLVVDIPEMKTVADKELEENLRYTMIETINKVTLKSTIADKDLFVFMRLNKRGITITCGDQIHAAYCTVGGSKSVEEVNVAFPINYIQLIRGLFDLKRRAIRIASSSGLMAISDNQFTLMLPMAIPAADDANMDLLADIFKQENYSKPLSSCGIDVKAVLEVINNLEAIRDTSLSLNATFVFKSNIVTIKSETRHGALSDVIEVGGTTKDRVTITFEVGILKDILSRIDKHAVFQVHEGNKCLITEQNLEAKRSTSFLLLGLMEN